MSVDIAEVRKAADSLLVYNSDESAGFYDDIDTVCTWALAELARRDAEAAERARPIDAEWLLSIGPCIRDDSDAFGVRLLPNATAIMERPIVSLAVLREPPSTIVHGRIGDSKIGVTVANRGELLDMLAALKVGES